MAPRKGSKTIMMLLGEASAGDIQRHLKSLIFVGVFFLTMIAAAIWWLKR